MVRTTADALGPQEAILTKPENNHTFKRHTRGTPSEQW